MCSATRYAGASWICLPEVRRPPASWRQSSETSSGYPSRPSRTTCGYCERTASPRCASMGPGGSTGSDPTGSATSTSGSIGSAASGQDPWKPSPPKWRGASERGSRHDARRRPSDLRSHEECRNEVARVRRSPGAHRQPRVLHRRRRPVGRGDESREDRPVVPAHQRRPPPGRPLQPGRQRLGHHRRVRPAAPFRCHLGVRRPGVVDRGPHHRRRRRRGPFHPRARRPRRRRPVGSVRARSDRRRMGRCTTGPGAAHGRQRGVGTEGPGGVGGLGGGSGLLRGEQRRLAGRQHPAGTDPAEAEAAAQRTTAFYTGVEAG